ncbi:MAG: CDP-alcohol phosphatidyltransferase family protein [Firmicutes bacterium]|nr:CDP-alcohol phosphatidyltransferase family protein [Bacillota bacterium]
MNTITRKIPNTLGIIRILLCIPLVILALTMPFSIPMMVIYITAGLTDIIDGPLARRIKNAQSEFGSTVDGVADMLLVIVSIFFVLPQMDIHFILIASVFGVLAYKIISGLIGALKHKETVLLHTYANKFIAVALWVTPIIYWVLSVLAGWQHAEFVVSIAVIFAVTCVVIATTEEILINLMLKKPSRDIKSVFGVRHANNRTENQNTEHNIE